MKKVEEQDKLLIDELKAKGDIFIYLGGAMQAAEDFGVNWRRVSAEALLMPPLNATTFDPTVVESQKFEMSMGEWDRHKRELKRDAFSDEKKEREFYRRFSPVVHLDLYALSQAHCAIIRLSRERTHGTTEEFVEYVLRTYKRPTLIFYDDDPEEFSEWMLQRGLEGKYEYYVYFKIFPTIKKIVKFIQGHKEDIRQWDENYRRSMKAIRVFRAFARKYWPRKKGLTEIVATQITAELKAIYSIVSEVKQHLQECESILASQKAVLIEERIVKLQQYLKEQEPPKPPRKKKS